MSAPSSISGNFKPIFTPFLNHPSDEEAISSTEAFKRLNELWGADEDTNDKTPTPQPSFYPNIQAEEVILPPIQNELTSYTSHIEGHMIAAGSRLEAIENSSQRTITNIQLVLDEMIQNTQINANYITQLKNEMNDANKIPGNLIIKENYRNYLNLVTKYHNLLKTLESEFNKAIDLLNAVEPSVYLINLSLNSSTENFIESFESQHIIHDYSTPLLHIDQLKQSLKTANINFTALVDNIHNMSQKLEAEAAKKLDPKIHPAYKQTAKKQMAKFQKIAAQDLSFLNKDFPITATFDKTLHSLDMQLNNLYDYLCVFSEQNKTLIKQHLQSKTRTELNSTYVNDQSASEFLKALPPSLIRI